MVVPCHPVGSAAAKLMFCMTRLNGAAEPRSQGRHRMPAPRERRTRVGIVDNKLPNATELRLSWRPRRRGSAMLPRPWICLLDACLLAARGISAAEPPVNSIAQNPLPELVGTVAARHGLPLGGTWQVVAPERVVLTPGEVDVAVTLYGLRDTSGLRALLLVPRNVLPGASGWGPPSACAGGGNPLLRLDVYHSPRDVLCGWAEEVVVKPPARPAA